MRGMVVRLTDAWTEILRRRASNTSSGPYAAPVQEMLGEMTAAAALMQSNIKFDGSLVLQIFGDGPVKVAVVEVQPDLSLRATATVTETVSEGSRLSQFPPDLYPPSRLLPTSATALDPIVIKSGEEKSGTLALPLAYFSPVAVQSIGTTAELT